MNNPHFEKKPLSPYLEIKIVTDVVDKTTNDKIELENRAFKIPSDNIIAFRYEGIGGNQISVKLELIDAYNAGRESNVSALDEILLSLFTMSITPRLKIKFGWQNWSKTMSKTELYFIVINYTYRRTNKGLGVILDLLPEPEKIKNEVGQYGHNFSKEEDINILIFLNKILHDITLNFWSIYYRSNEMCSWCYPMNVQEIKKLKNYIYKEFISLMTTSSGVHSFKNKSEANILAENLAVEIGQYICFEETLNYDYSKQLKTKRSDYSANPEGFMKIYYLAAGLMVGSALIFETGKAWQKLSSSSEINYAKTGVNAWVQDLMGANKIDNFRSKFLQLSERGKFVNKNLSYIGKANISYGWNLSSSATSELKKYKTRIKKGHADEGYSPKEIIKLLVEEYNDSLFNSGSTSGTSNKNKILKIAYINCPLIETGSVSLSSGKYLEVERIKKFPTMNKTFAQNMNLLLNKYIGVKSGIKDTDGEYTNKIYTWHISKKINPKTKKIETILNIVGSMLTEVVGNQKKLDRISKRSYYLGGENTNIFDFNYEVMSGDLILYQNIFDEQSIRILAQTKETSQTIYIKSKKTSKATKKAKGKSFTLTSSKNNEKEVSFIQPITTPNFKTIQINNITSLTNSLNINDKTNYANKTAKTTSGFSNSPVFGAGLPPVSDIMKKYKTKQKRYQITYNAEKSNVSTLPKRYYVNLLSNNWSASAAGEVLLKKIYQQQAKNYLPQITFSIIGDPKYVQYYTEADVKTKTDEVHFGDKIKIIILNINGKINYLLSGYYMVQEFSHIISQGRYITTVKALRSFPLSPE